MSVAYINDTVNLVVTFRSWSSGGPTPQPEDPQTVTVNVYDMTAATPTLLITAIPNNLSVGVYSYDWTPTVLGEFEVQFLGEFADGTQDLVREEFSVQTEDSIPTTGVSLMSDEVITFAAGLDPLYLEPEELTSIYPDASLVDIAEQIWSASAEVKAFYKLKDGEEPPFLALEYIKAAAACALSKTYDLESGSELSVRLGDLSVTNRSFPKQSLNRGNATTWCELAIALKKEMQIARIGMKSVVKGDALPNPMPIRALRSR